MTSKLSIHLSDFIYNHEMDWVEQAGLKAVKFCFTNSEMNMDELRRRGVVEIVYRPRYPGDIDGHPELLTPEMAVDFILTQKPALLTRNLIWEGLCEPKMENAEQADALDAWNLEWAERMHALSPRQRVAILSLSEGNPKDLSLLSRCKRSLAEADFVAWHEYDRCFGLHRKVWDALPIKKPMWLTETGLSVPRQLSPEDYLALMAAYDAELAKDSYVLGAFWYQLGDVDQWLDFSIRSEMDLFVSYVKSQGGGFMPNYHPSPAPAPSPEPVYWIKVTPTSIKAGESATLEYFAEHVKAAWLDNEALAPAVGSKVVSPRETTTYRLKVQLPEVGYVTVSATLVVTTAPTPPPSQPTDCFIDPRATWIKVTQGTRYKVLGVWFYDNVPVGGTRVPKEITESQRSTRVSVKVVNTKGVGLPFEYVLHRMQDEDWAGRTDVNGVAWFDVFHDNWIDPGKWDSPDQVVVGDAVVKNVSLPLSRDAAYAIIFEKQGNDLA